METAAKSAQEKRATDRVLEALTSLAALLDRSINEVKNLDSDFQNRLLQAVHETETSLRHKAAEHLDTALTETRTKLEEQFTRRLAELSARWDEERGRLNSEIGNLTQSVKEWEVERARLQGELERLARVQAATQAEAEKAILAMKTASTAAGTATASPSPGGEALTAEVTRVETIIKEISALIEDPNTELSTVIRKNVERAELESYVKGIRFALDGSASR